MSWEDLEPEPDEPPSTSPWWSGWWWPLFAVIAFLIFELTASLVWSSLFFSLRFGWSDSYTGWFLWKHDPRLPRGRALALFHLAAGLCRVFWVSLLLSIVFAILAVNQQQNIAVRDRFLFSSGILLITVVTGIIGCGVLTLLGAGIAGHNQIKLWVGSETYLSARAALWPPLTHGTNRIGRVGLLAMVPVTCAGLILLVGLAACIAKLLGNAGLNMELIGLGVGVACPVLGAILYLVGVERISGRIGASWPWECWPELHGEQSVANDVAG